MPTPLPLPTRSRLRLWARRMRWVVLAVGILALGPATTPAETDPGQEAEARAKAEAWLNAMGSRATRAAQSLGKTEVEADTGGPARDAVVRVGGCTGALITPRIVLSVAHCAPHAGQASGEPHPACRDLTQQSGLARHPWIHPNDWLDIPAPTLDAPRPPDIRIGHTRNTVLFSAHAEAIAVPRCADMLLLRLAVPVPPEVATPLPIMTEPPINVDREFGRASLRHSGWGVPKVLRTLVTQRQSGPVRYWGASDCHLLAEPPLRPDGRRIIGGDSGSPLLLRRGDTEIVVGILWGSGLADAAACGFIHPRPPTLHGSYTPTWRRQILGTGSTDLGAWLRHMVPDADHR